MGLFNSIINFFLENRIHEIERFCERPLEVQSLVFKELIHKAKGTEWGRLYGYTDELSIREFQQRVPISTYETLFPYIERMLRGEQNILWPSPIEWFSKSSGTTNDRSKYIPVSAEALEDTHLKAGRDMICLYITQFNTNSKVFEGKSLSIGGTHGPNPWNPETSVGDVSAIIVQNLPLWAEYARAPAREIFLLPKWEEKIAQMLLTCADENITNLSGVPTWMVVVLQRMVEHTGKKNILEVWPNLEVFLHGAVAFDPYRDLFKQLIPKPDFHYLELYNASEGFFGIQDSPSRHDLLLLLDHGVFYEFVPIEELDRAHPIALTLDQVQLERNYALLISTNAGLWRYLIGDTIKFTSLSPFRFKITGRTKQFINAFGEELMVENADRAITEACKATEASIVDYTAAPKYLDGQGNKGGHEWLIEFERDPKDLALFAKVLDDTLRKVNSDYDAKRYQDIALQMPQVKPLPRGVFYAWLKSKQKLGGQHKVPRLSNDRKYVDEILDFSIRQVT